MTPKAGSQKGMMTFSDLKQMVFDYRTEHGRSPNTACITSRSLSSVLASLDIWHLFMSATGEMKIYGLAPDIVSGPDEWVEYRD